MVCLGGCSFVYSWGSIPVYSGSHYQARVDSHPSSVIRVLCYLFVCPGQVDLIIPPRGWPVRAIASGGQWCPATHLKYVPHHSTFGALVAAYIQYSILKMWPPLLFFGPSWFLASPAAKSWRRACAPLRLSSGLGVLLAKLRMALHTVFPLLHRSCGCLYFERRLAYSAVYLTQ